jgi:hypothetical protein
MRGKTAGKRLSVPCMDQVGNVAGHSYGGSSPSRTRAYVHAGSPFTWSNLPSVLRLIGPRSSSAGQMSATSTDPSRSSLSPAASLAAVAASAPR